MPDSTLTTCEERDHALGLVQGEATTYLVCSRCTYFEEAGVARTPMSEGCATHIPTASIDRAMIFCQQCGLRLTRGATVPGCTTCSRDFSPAHFASTRCESGGHTHCSCDACF